MSSLNAPLIEESDLGGSTGKFGSLSMIDMIASYSTSVVSEKDAFT